MKLEQQVASLELSRKLKELGVEQESAFYWWWDFNYKNEPCNIDLRNHGPILGKNENRACAAFTVAELGELLPEKISTGFDSLQIHKNGSWEVMYGLYGTTFEAEEFKPTHAEEDENLANALAKMLVYLIEQGILPKVEGEV